MMWNIDQTLFYVQALECLICGMAALALFCGIMAVREARRRTDE